MVYCNYCRCETDVEIDDAKGISCCVGCGRVLEDIAFSADVTFQKDAAGESTVAGQFVNESGVARGIGRIHGGRVYAFQADSHERAQLRGRQDISFLVDHLKIRHREESIESAHRLYKLALQRGFTRGRRTNQVAAACLYLVCRQDNKPFLLIDFSDALQISVFTLGAVFLQLAKLLRLEEHPLFVKPVDPSLYIHRFADKMNFPNRMALEEVAETAVRLVASMKRDWIQTGRRPSGVCGAALYIAAHMHGYERTKKSIVSIVHIGEHTLTKRLTEFSSTEAAALKKKDFKEKIDAIQSTERAEIEADPGSQPPPNMIAGCEHLGLGEEHFRHGMCRACYTDFVSKSGGMHDGMNPPAYSKNRAMEAKKTAALALTALGEPLALPAPGDEEEEGDGVPLLAIENGTANDNDGDTMNNENENGNRRSSTRARNNNNKKDTTTTTTTTTTDTMDDNDMDDDENTESDDDDNDNDNKTTTTNNKRTTRSSNKMKLTAELIQAAEAEVNGFDEAIAEAEAEDARRRRRGGKGGFSDAAILAMANSMAVQDAVRSIGKKGQGKRKQEIDPFDDDEDEEDEDDEEDVSMAAAGALVPVGGGDTSTLPLTIAMGNNTSTNNNNNDALALVPHPYNNNDDDDEQQEEDKETLSDVDDADIEMYIADEEEVKCKEEIWNMMNQDWVEKQLAKKQALEAAERAQAEQRAAMEAAAAAGVQYKRGRGRPLGSKSKPKPEHALPPAETPQEAAMRMLQSKKLSSKINYSVLADLFSDDGMPNNDNNTNGGSGSGSGSGGDNNKRGRKKDTSNTNATTTSMDNNGDEGKAKDAIRPTKQQKTTAKGTSTSSSSMKTTTKPGSKFNFQPRLGSLKSQDSSTTTLKHVGSGGGGGGVKRATRLGGLQEAVGAREGLRSHGVTGKGSEKKSGGKKVSFSQGTKKK